MSTNNMKIKLVAIAKDEAAYLPEWIFHHLTFGFDEIEIYVNNTVDETYQVISNIAKHYPVIANKADKLFQTSNNNFQLLAYNDAVNNAQKGGFTHIMFLDVDEFWTPADFTSTIKQALALYQYPQALSLNWFIHCDEKTFSTCYKPTVKILPNPHVKTIFALDNQWDKIEIHNIVGKGITHTRGNGEIYDFSDSAHCALTDNNCLDHSFFIIHRMYRSEMEYISRVAQGRANKLKLKNNRNGYYQPNNQFTLISFEKGLLDSYYQRYDEFIQQCDLQSLIEVSQYFVQQRFQQVLAWAKKANKRDALVFSQLFKHITLPDIVSLQNQFEKKEQMATLLANIPHLPSARYLYLALLSKIYYRLGWHYLAINTFVKAEKENSDAINKAVLPVITKALTELGYPEKKYADFYRELAIHYRKRGMLTHAVVFIRKAKQYRPNGPYIIQLFDSYMKEYEAIVPNYKNVKNND